MKSFRADSLDALRGFAIFMMVLSGSIVTWVLPAWMSHAQVPPPAGVFDPSVPGITWVDLVFPFFLFSMGAAFPFSVGARLARGTRRSVLALEAVWRGVKLAFFAIFIQHIHPWVMSAGGEQTPAMWLVTLAGFVLLFPIYLRLPGNPPAWLRYVVQWTGVALAVALMWWLDCRDGGSFNLYQSNIIILVLANMALFGTIIYIYTINNPVARVAVLPLLMAIILCKTEDGSWQQTVFNWSPAPWLYQFNFVKYLFIIIPGTFAGEYLRRWITDRNTAADRTAPRHGVSTAMVLLLSVALIVVNLCCLFARHTVTNLFLSVAMAAMAVFFARRLPSDSKVLMRLVTLGGYLLVTGLFFEAYEGGIRKDPSSFSYYFVTSGLASYCLSAFIIICDIYRCRTLMAPLTMSGKNPMIAYVATSWFIMPLLNLCHLGDSFTLEFFTRSPLLGFLHGFVLTALACMTAMFFTRIRWFWRT